MNRCEKTQNRIKMGWWLGISFVLLSAGCSPKKAPAPQAEQLSAVKVTVSPSGPVVLTTSEAEFDVLPSGYIQAYLLKDGKRLTLDEPGSGVAGASDYLVSSGKEVRNFSLDFSHVKVSDARGKLGARGKRVEITAPGLNIPAKYNTETTLGQEVALDAKGIQEGISFDLKF